MHSDLPIKSVSKLKQKFRKFLYKKRLWVLLFLFSALTIPSAVILAVDYYVNYHRQELLATINRHLGLDLKVSRIDVIWRLHRPSVKLSDVSIEVANQVVAVKEFQIGIRVRESLVTSQIRFGGIEASGLEIELPNYFQKSKTRAQSNDSTPNIEALVNDLVGVWRLLASAVPHLLLSDSTIILPTDIEKTILKIDSLEIKATAHVGKILGVVSINTSKPLFFQLNLDVQEPAGLQLKGQMNLSDFPIPLFHTSAKDYALIPRGRLHGHCTDFGSTPCVKLESGKVSLEFGLSPKEWTLKLVDFEGKAKGIEAKGSTNVRSTVQGTFFDVDVRSASGQLEPVLAILDSEWIGIETYKWLLNHLKHTRAENGSVRIKGATHIEDYEKFLIAMNVNAQEIQFDAAWPSITDALGLLKITSDHLKLDISRGTFANVPLENSEFMIPSFSTPSTLGLIKVHAKADYGRLKAALLQTPLKEIFDEIAIHCDIVGDKDINANLGLQIDFTEFDKNGIKYQVETVADDLDVTHTSKIVGLIDAKVNLNIKGQSAGPKSETTIEGSFNGGSAGRWILAEKIFGKLKLDVNQPFYGLSVKLGESEARGPLVEGVMLDLPSAQGKIEFQKQQAFNNINAKFDRFIIPKSAFASEQNSKTEKVEQAPAAKPFDPKLLPAFDVNIKSLKYGEVDFGMVRLTANRIDLGPQQLKGVIENQKFNIEVEQGSWVSQDSSKSSFAIKGKIKSANTGDMLNSLGIYQGLTEGKSEGEFDLSWAGSPWDFAAKMMAGSAKYKLVGGQLQAMDNFLMKIIDILTLKNVKFYEKGTKIVQSEGSLVFESGQMKMQPFKLEMPSAKIVVNGSLNFIEDTISTDVGMELNIADTAAVVTAGAIFGPFGALTTYFATDGYKLPGYEVFNKLTAFSYRLTGPIAKPKFSSFKSAVFTGGIESKP